MIEIEHTEGVQIFKNNMIYMQELSCLEKKLKQL